MCHWGVLYLTKYLDFRPLLSSANDVIEVWKYNAYNSQIEYTLVTPQREPKSKYLVNLRCHWGELYLTKYLDFGSL
jgi:hypothetical protein